MGERTLFYATNRGHIGRDRWHPDAYGTAFSQDGIENLRFGKIALDANEETVGQCLTAEGRFGTGDGVRLADHFSQAAATGRITAYPESLDPSIADIHQRDAQLGSQAMFAELRTAMMENTDVLICIHGFNISWHEAVGSALALQEMLNRSTVRDTGQSVLIVLFTWPSNGQALPFVSYKSDRTEARGSGYAFGRGILKMRDFLMTLNVPCSQDLHLLCHSLGNYVLQHALARIAQFTTGSILPRVFEHIFLCAADVDDDVLESGGAMERLHEMARSVDVYHNRGDVAMYISDYTKGHPERLGTNGSAHPLLLHNKVRQIDCTPVVKGEGLIEHDYYLVGHVNADIRQSIDGIPYDDERRRRVRSVSAPNVWTLRAS